MKDLFTLPERAVPAMTFLGLVERAAAAAIDPETHPRHCLLRRRGARSSGHIVPTVRRWNARGGMT